MLLVFVGTYAYMTPAPLSDKLPAARYNKNQLSQQKTVATPFALTDITLQAGIQRRHNQRSEHLSGLHESLGAGACALDYDNDGWVDLLVLNGSGTTHFHGKPQWWQANDKGLTLYKNNRDETFTDVTASSGLSTTGWTMGCAYGDIDNDGDHDIFISQWGENQLWENDKGYFKNITQTTGIKGKNWSTSVNFLDVNRDGLLDIYVNNFIDFTVNALTFEHQSGYTATLPPAFDASLYNGQANQLWLNQGNVQGKPFFIEQAHAMGIANPQGRSLHSQWLDINNDHYLDVIIANHKGASNKVFLNNAGNGFTDISLPSRLSFTDKASHISIGDFDHNTLTDLFFGTDHQTFAKLYQQSENANVTFTEVSHALGLSTSTKANQSHWGSVIEDINMDGWSDIYLANGLSTPNKDSDVLSRGQPNSLLLYHNGFRDNNQHLSPHTYNSQSSRCALAIDINNNGRADIYTSNNNDLGQLLKNTGPSRPWLGIELVADKTPVIGAKVTVDTGKQQRTQVYGNKHSFLCMGDQRLRFALANIWEDNTTTVTVTVAWPDGTQQLLTDITLGHYHRIVYQQHHTALLPTSTQPTLSGSSIVYQQPLHKLTVIEWLIAEKNLALAEKELRLLSTLPFTAANDFDLARVKAARLLPEQQQLPFIQQALNSPSTEARVYAIGLVKENENELLHRWLVRQLQHTDHRVACAAAETYAHFFDEEEAFILYKYTALSDLIRMTDSGSEEKIQCAINALGKSEHYRALQPLLALATTPTARKENTRIAAIKALALLKEKAALLSLQALANDTKASEALRRHARHSMATIDTPLSITSSHTLPLGLQNEKIAAAKPAIQPSLILDKTVFYKTLPDTIIPYLEKNHPERQALLVTLAIRKERWARDIVMEVLRNTSESAEIKAAIIQQLPRPLSAGYQQLLTQLLQQWVADYQQIAAEDPTNEDALIALGRVIFSLAPGTAIDLALQPQNIKP